MIDSKAGQRFARAEADRQRAFSAENKDIDEACRAQQEFDDAAKALAELIIADGHHAAEDYS
ncbi:hypothetical protein [Vreelandella titanicae]|uniref:hypothetical protein n=1 Tax=Vreelandella titanicae TaxID=664683 RepID=UPI0037F966AE